MEPSDSENIIKKKSINQKGRNLAEGQTWQKESWGRGEKMLKKKTNKTKHLKQKSEDVGQKKKKSMKEKNGPGIGFLSR